jgi:hypothetical protein
MPSTDRTEGLAILAIDPGRTSGVAAAYVPRLGTLKDSLRAATHKKAIEVKGIDLHAEIPTNEEDWVIHARRLQNIINKFSFRALLDAGYWPEDIHVVFEDFVLRRKKQGGATGNLTSVWVMAGAIASFKNSVVSSPANFHYQQASLAKGKATNARLKQWGLYEPGSEHCKDAWRHLATLADKLL